MNIFKEDVLDFRLNFKVIKKKRSGFFNFQTYNEETTILNNVRGTIQSNTLTAILGASGSGKTTLLAALSQRIRDGVLSGEILLNGEVMDRRKMTRISGFLAQSDVILDGITVREHFYFMIEFKLPNLLSREKKLLIKNSLVKFGLNENTKLKHLSSGEMRRLSLATELLTKPKILFVDECTSGLDSFSALSVINTLRELAITNQKSQSRIVLMSIHQPTSEIFHLFTNIILMAAGRIIFHGTVKEVADLFNSMNLFCPSQYNPCEFYVNSVADPRKCTKIVNFIASKDKCEYDDIHDNQSSSLSSETNLEDDKDYDKLSWLRQCQMISYRSILNFCRSPKQYLIELFILILFSIVIMSVYFDISFESASNVQDIKGYLIILSTEILYTFTYAVFTLIYIDLPLLRKETGNRLYSLSAYYFSLVVLMIPRVIFETILYTAIIYFATDVGRDITTFFNIVFAITLSGVCAMAYGFFLSGLFESFFIATELSGIVDLILILVSGMYMNVKHVPLLKYISFFFYANESIAIIFWTKVNTIKCHPNPEIQCFSNGTEVLENLGYGTTQFDLYMDYFYQFILTIILHIFAFIGIKRNVTRSGFY
ncbi:hypothetical protein PVAND_009018 [Polypedilum vanderplanki]|uniref:ABC transporter domain-containing protein n=1 Tax=Polypedilum vanderplanki TaxID=319348 RepID=A0A9J6CC02_POLVA|nr:hypothetical protein PVAND_009018 [Polypedilum vanderplanki]